MGVDEPTGDAIPPLLPQPREMALDRTDLVDFSEPNTRKDASLHDEGYRIEIGAGRIEIASADDAGNFYARQTLAQLRRVYGQKLPRGLIADWPDYSVRGVMLDISRDKVPTMESLFGLVDRVSSWKVNQLQLYMEHTFAYRDHEIVWRDASPMTPDEIRELDLYCAQRHVELVPNQNCLGHFERWLRYDAYRDLAIKPEGVSFFGRPGPPTTLDPAKPGSLSLVLSMLGELLPNFRSRRVHVGLDEPWELRADRAAEYLSWITKLRAAPELDGREMLVWGDFLATHPSLIAEVPEGVTVCEWGYESRHAFGQRAAKLKEAGRTFWVCPGTSSWMSILGRWRNARANLESAAEAGLTYGAAGYLNTDWGDLPGHLSTRR